MNLEDTFEVRTIGSRRHSLAQRSVIDKAIDIPQPTNLSVQRVSDWKGHVVSRFGDLLLYDRLDVVTARSDIARPVSIRC